jgi:hypothetical protein
MSSYHICNCSEETERLKKDDDDTNFNYISPEYNACDDDDDDPWP